MSEARRSPKHRSPRRDGSDDVIAARGDGILLSMGGIKPRLIVQVSIMTTHLTVSRTLEDQIEFDSIPDALAAIRNGACVVVVDDEQRENEGDLICAAQFATPEAINFMATEARGLICLAMEGSRLDALDLPLMVDRNTDENETAFTVSIDAGREHGVSTGISAEDRASHDSKSPSILHSTGRSAAPRPHLPLARPPGRRAQARRAHRSRS